MEDLKKRFIVEENLEEKKVVGYIERLLPFCKVTKNGDILLGAKALTTLEKVKTALIARYLANHLEPTIPSEITPEELSNMLDIPRDQINARLKDVRDEKFAINFEGGKYRAKPFEIGRFLETLEKKYSENKNETE
jgi:hypothetical protein